MNKINFNTGRKPSNEKPGSPTVVTLNTNNEDQHKPVLSPAWYEYSTDGKVTDMALIDGLNHCFNEVRAISKLLMSAGDNADVVISGSAISQTAGILSDKMREADYFVELWRKANTDTK